MANDDQPALPLSHQELNLLIFAIEGAPAEMDAPVETPSCEDACPVVNRIEQALGLGTSAGKEKLARHLKEHLREALIESGAFKVIGQVHDSNLPADSSSDEPVRMINERLAQWSCLLRIDGQEKMLLIEGLRSLPLSAWLSMPGLLWRLKRKLKKYSA